MTSVSTADEDARVRFPFKGTFVDVSGEFVTHYDGSKFLSGPAIWEHPWLVGFRYSATGLDVLRRTIMVDGKRAFVPVTWSGTLNGGARDPAGTCDNWTSADPTKSAQVIHALQGEKRGPAWGKATLSCNAYARILCLGEGALPAKKP